MQRQLLKAKEERTTDLQVVTREHHLLHRSNDLLKGPRAVLMCKDLQADPQVCSDPAEVRTLSDPVANPLPAHDRADPEVQVVEVEIETKLVVKNQQKGDIDLPFLCRFYGKGQFSGSDGSHSETLRLVELYCRIWIEQRYINS